jgi:hypothetical protein
MPPDRSQTTTRPTTNGTTTPASRSPANKSTSQPSRARTGPTTTGRPGGVGVSTQDRDTVRAAVLALAPLTDEQIAAVCEVITVTRERWHREDTACA